ncbi:hypothetical protein AcW2_006211 [Taiwanofungus camphoratus]|nr:hypothetical protein AcW2_006211 [Antrodia cinnamomea]
MHHSCPNSCKLGPGLFTHFLTNSNPAAFPRHQEQATLRKPQGFTFTNVQTRKKYRACRIKRELGKTKENTSGQHTSTKPAPWIRRNKDLVVECRDAVPFLNLPARKVESSSVDSPGRRLPLLRDMLARHHFPDFDCLQEVRARHSDKAWIVALKATANQCDGTPRYTPYTSLNKSTRGQRHFGVITQRVRRPRLPRAR